MSKILFAEAEGVYNVCPELNISYTQVKADNKNVGGKYIYIGSEKKIDLTRLDYLALGDSSEIRNIIIDCVRTYDIGCPASQVILQTDAIQNLEHELASLHNLSDCITFLSGYTTNNNIIVSLGLRLAAPHVRYYLRKLKMNHVLAAQRTAFFVDKESHYSVFYAIKQAKALGGSKCSLYTYESANYLKLHEIINNFEKKCGDSALKIIVSDTVSSTTGRTFDIKALCRIAQEYDAILYLDEAHAVGAIGEQGGGVSSCYDDFEKYKERIIVMGTLTKAIIQLGGYATYNNPHLTTYFKLLSPQYIFSTTVPPWMAVATAKILHLIRDDYGKQKRSLLHSRAESLRKLLITNDFNILQSNTHIISVLVKDDNKAAEVQKFLLNKGIITSLFKYPAVPKNSALIRFSICADITEKEIDSVGRLMISARDKIKF